MSLRAAEGNFSKFIEEIVLAFQELTHSKGITLFIIYRMHLSTYGTTAD